MGSINGGLKIETKDSGPFGKYGKLVIADYSNSQRPINISSQRAYRSVGGTICISLWTEWYSVAYLL